MKMRLTGFIIVLFLSVFAFNAQGQADYVHPERLDLAKSVQIFPNPAVDFIHVRVDQLPAQNLKLTLHNIIGNEIAIESEMISEHEIRVRVKDLSAGYYLIALKDDQDKFQGTYKFLKR